MKRFAPILAVLIGCAGGAFAQEAANTEAVTFDDIRWFNSDDVPTYKIGDDGTLDWASFSGYRRYHAECHVCHGPDGEGSTYAPALKTSAIKMDYYDFTGIVASGKQEISQSQNQVMPAFATNPNVMCYLDDIYSYLRARGTEAIPRGRPAKKETKTEAYATAEAECMEG